MNVETDLSVAQSKSLLLQVDRNNNSLYGLQLTTCTSSTAWPFYNGAAIILDRGRSLHSFFADRPRIRLDRGTLCAARYVLHVMCFALTRQPAVRRINEIFRSRSRLTAASNGRNLNRGENGASSLAHARSVHFIICGMTVIVSFTQVCVERQSAIGVCITLGISDLISDE